MRTPSSDRPRRGFLGRVDPRRSLGARLTLLVFAPVALAFGGAAWAVSGWLAARTEADVVRLVEAQAIRQARAELHRAADLRREELDGRSFELLRVLGELRASVAEALDLGPERGSAAERLADEPGLPLVVWGGRRSAALLSRRNAGDGRSLGDLAATRRLEPRFSEVLARNRYLVAAFVSCRSGVVRTVPGSDLARILASGRFEPGFQVGDRWSAGSPAEERPPHFTVTDPGLPSGRGAVVTAVTPVFGRDGLFRAEAGVSLVLGEWMGRGAFRRWPGEVERVYAADGTLLFEGVAGGGEAVDPVDRSLDLLPAVRGSADVDVDVPAPGGGTLLVAVRPVAGVGWVYVRSVSAAAVRGAGAGTLETVASEARTRRRGAGLTALALLPFVLVAVALSARAILAPLRRLDGKVNGIAGGVDPPGRPQPGRRDEVGRLETALASLESRLCRRDATLSGIQRLVREVSALAGPSEACGLVARGSAQLVGAEKGWVFLWEPGRRRLAGVAPGHGLSDGTVSSMSVAPEDHSLAMLSFRTGETFVSNDAWSDPKISTPLARKAGLVRNALFTPLSTEEGPIGVLVLLDKAGPFDAADETAVASVASQAALLLRSARLYEELERSHARMRAAWRGRDHFLQNINHELRTPLTAILGWSEILADDRPDAATTALALEQIRRSALFLHTLISDLLDLSRFDEAGTKLEREDVDLGRLVREAVEPGAVMAESKGIVFTVVVPPEGTLVRVDPLRIRQVLWNLVHNAAKFTQRGGRIEVRAGLREDEAVFHVTDDGVGVDPKDLPFLFDRFRQADGSTTRAHRGAGIGLTLAKAFVELHGGTISVESAPGRGAVFTVRIPVRPSGEAKLAQA